MSEILHPILINNNYLESLSYLVVPFYLLVGCVVLSLFSHVQLVVTLWTVAFQASLSMGFSRQEYWSELPCPPPGDLPEAGIEPASPASPALADRFITTSTTWEFSLVGYWNLNSAIVYFHKVY